MRQVPDHAGVEAMKRSSPAQRVGVLLGAYLSDAGWRELRAVDTLERGICLIDDGADAALLVEPGLEHMPEVRALAADYLALAQEFGAPQVKQPWPPAAGHGAPS